MLDCIIVGGGPAGLSAGLNLVRRGKDILVLSSGVSLLEKAELVDNHLGMPSITGAEMMRNFEAHAKACNVPMRAAKVGNIMPLGDHFMVNADGDILEARSIILCAGVSKASPVPGESELLGRGVSYCATCDGMLYRGRAVAVWGLTADAAHEANYLAEIGCNVTFIALKRPEGLLESIHFLTGRVSEIKGNEIVSAVVVGEAVLPVEGVFVLRNATPPDVLLPGLAVADGAVVVDRQCATNIPGVYAAGDMTGKPLQVSNATGEGLIAALAVAEYLGAQSIPTTERSASK